MQEDKTEIKRSRGTFDVAGHISPFRFGGSICEFLHQGTIYTEKRKREKGHIEA